MPPGDKMSVPCRQCGFEYARIDTEQWHDNSSRRAMCPVCGWTFYEEYRLQDSVQTVVKQSEGKGYGAYRLVPPGGYSGYNAFHAVPDARVIANIRELLTDKGWTGYLTLWDESAGRPRLILGNPLQKFDAIPKE